MDYLNALIDAMRRDSHVRRGSAATNAASVTQGGLSPAGGAAVLALHREVDRIHTEAQRAGSTKELRAVSGDMGPGGGIHPADIARKRAWEDYPVH